MKLQVESLPTVFDPTQPQVKDGIERVYADQSQFIILELDENTFMQVSDQTGEGRFTLEYFFNSSSQEYKTLRTVSKEHAIEAFNAFYSNDETRLKNFNWETVELDDEKHWKNKEENKEKQKQDDLKFNWLPNEGKLSRTEFVIWLAVYNLIGAGIAYYFKDSIELHFDKVLNGAEATRGGSIVILGGVALQAWINLCGFSKRTRDAGLHAGLSVLAVIPVVNLLYFILLLLIPTRQTSAAEDEILYFLFKISKNVGSDYISNETGIAIGYVDYCIDNLIKRKLVSSNEVNNGPSRTVMISKLGRKSIVEAKQNQQDLVNPAYAVGKSENHLNQ